jgi:hypothetical protein
VDVQEILTETAQKVGEAWEETEDKARARAAQRKRTSPSNCRYQAHAWALRRTPRRPDARPAARTRREESGRRARLRAAASGCGA